MVQNLKCMVEKKGKDGLSVENWSLNKNDLGRQGEALVRRWLIAHEYSVLPASLINEGSAPMLRRKLTSLILPDNLTWKAGDPSWVEVKTKSHATQRKFPPYAQRWEHGLPERHWKNYCVIQEVTRIPVSLAVLQLDKKMLFISQLDSLRKGVRIAEMDGELHVFLNLLDTNYLSDFDKWYRLNDDYSLPDSIQPLAWRTLAQSSDPLIRQLILDEFIDYLRKKTEEEDS